MKMMRYSIFIFTLFLGMLLYTSKTFAALEPERVGGKDRYETAVKISQDTWQQANYAVLVSGQDFPDALTATPLAKKYDAPILLSKQDSLNDMTKQELIRLKVQHVFIIGGMGVIEENVVNSVKAMGIDVARIGGVNRYETAVQVAGALGINNKIIIVSGENFPDAISIATIAAQEQIPILLTNKDQLSGSVKQYLKDKTIDTSYVIGGTAVISETVAAQLPNNRRLYGKDRYETNISILKEFESAFNFDTVYVASGNSFADALTGSAAAAKTSSPVVLIKAQVVAVSQAYIKEKLDNIKYIKILGGSSIVSGSSVRKLLSEKVYKVVLDPGHGGFDPGAIGSVGLREKDVNLSVALKVGQLLANRGVEVIYTRNSDVLPWESNKTADLQTRSDISNASEPDYFVSIHSNSSPIPWVNGTATYYKSGNEGAMALAQIVQRELVKAIGTKDNGVLTENFSVLRKTDDPAILVELAFISNPSEEQALSSESFQNKMADAIARAIVQALN